MPGHITPEALARAFHEALLRRAKRGPNAAVLHAFEIPWDRTTKSHRAKAVAAAADVIEWMGGQAISEVGPALPGQAQEPEYRTTGPGCRLTEDEIDAAIMRPSGRSRSGPGPFSDARSFYIHGPPQTPGYSFTGDSGCEWPKGGRIGDLADLEYWKARALAAEGQLGYAVHRRAGDTK